MYHRSYEEREPIEVRISHGELVVLSFPGPDRSIRLADLQAGHTVSRRYRDRRIGEFLKELDLTEGRATGISKILKVMAADGPPSPVFERDDERTSFVIRLPVHPLAPVTSPVATTEVTMEVTALLAAINGAMSRQALQDVLRLKNAEHLRKAYLVAIAAGCVEMTRPDQPKSRLQRYRLTTRGLRRRREIKRRQ